jgi:4-hydroxybenzoate polyprenyltransferase
MVVFSALCNGQFDFFPLLGLFIIGIFTYLFGAVQNDYFDLEIDKKSEYVSERPLVKGIVSLKGALFLIIFSFFASIILAYVFFFTILSFLTLLLSFFLATLYNKYSKSMPGMEYVLAAAHSTFALFGALTVSDVLSPLVIFIVLFVLMFYVFNVGVSANLKDVKYDSKQGIKTTPMILGVTVIDDELRIPAVFTTYAFSIMGIYIGIALMPFLTGYVSIFLYGFPVPIVCFSILSTLLIYTLWKILSTPLSYRDKMIRYAGIHELLMYFLVPVVLMSYLVENINIFAPILLIAVPPLWVTFYVRVFFGKRMPLE